VSNNRRVSPDRLEAGGRRGIQFRLLRFFSQLDESGLESSSLRKGARG
jgi:hypothetical protein